MCFQNPVQARLWRDLKAQRQLGSPMHSPAFPDSSALSVLIRVIRGSLFLPCGLPAAVSRATAKPPGSAHLPRCLVVPIPATRSSFP